MKGEALLARSAVGTGARPYCVAVSTEATVDPRPSLIVMIATYVVAGVGLFIGFSTIFGDPPSLTWATLLAVGGGVAGD